jgi:hypothetical protein
MGTLKGFANPPGVVALIGVALAAPGCAFPPWSMGAPLDGRPSIPATTAAPSIPSLRALAVAERAAGHTALELKALDTIARAERLNPDERERVIVLLEQRARELLALGRAVPACEDLRELEELAPARARALARLHAAAERDAGDAWLAVGDPGRAREAYEIAASLGAAETDFRLAAAAQPPARVEPGAAERAVLELPLRAVPPYAEIYLEGGAAAGVIETDPAVRRAALERAWLAARQERMRPLAERLHALIAAADPGALPPQATSLVARATDAQRLADALLDAPAGSAAVPPPGADPQALDRWAVGTAAVSTRLLLLLQILAAQPEPATVAPAATLLAPGERSRRWVELLLEEDPTSPDVLEVAAVVDALAGRIGGSERKLVDLVYFTPDRYQGLVRAANIWERVGQVRHACAAWLRAARWRDEPDDPVWGRAIACMRRDPGAGDWRSVLSYVLARTPPERRAAAAAALDPGATPLGAPAAPPVSDRPAGAPIPCDTGGSPR